MEAIATFSYDVDRYPDSKDAGTMLTTIGFVTPPNMQLPIPRNTFSISVSVNEFIQNEQSLKTEEILNFLKEARVHEGDINLVIMSVIELAKLVIYSPEEYCLDFGLLLWVTIDLTDQQAIDELRMQEVTQTSLDELNIKCIPASKLAIVSLKQEPYESHKNNDCCSNCTICLKDFNDGKIVTVLPCRHIFHVKCITTWFHINHVCPLCRFELTCEE